MKRLKNISFALLAVSAILDLALAASAQTRRTVAEARADHNAEVCGKLGLSKTCTQAEIDAEVLRMGAAPGVYKSYATDAAFRDGELLPAILSKRTEERNNRASETLNRAFQSLTPAKRVAVCTAAELPDPEVCR